MIGAFVMKELNDKYWRVFESDHSFTFAKLSKKVISLTLWYTHTYVCVRRVKKC